MINVLINGCNGKMGQEIATLIHISHSFVLIGELLKLFPTPIFVMFLHIIVKSPQGQM